MYWRTALSCWDLPGCSPPSTLGNTNSQANQCCQPTGLQMAFKPASTTKFDLHNVILTMIKERTNLQHHKQFPVAAL